MRYKIDKHGAIHLHGVMPNTNQVGWYLYGWVGSYQTLNNLAGSLLPDTQSADEVATINRMLKGSVRALRQCLIWRQEPQR